MTPALPVRPNLDREERLAQSTSFSLVDIQAVFDASPVSPDLIERFIRSAATLGVALDPSAAAAFFLADGG